jgi:hypothetical protein
VRPAHTDRTVTSCHGPCRHLPVGTEPVRLSPTPDLARDLIRVVGSALSPEPALGSNHVDPARIVACPVRGRAIAAVYQAGADWDDAALPAYRAFRAETARQFELLTRSAGRGGLGIEVRRSVADPYPDAAAMAAEVGSVRRLRIFATNGTGNGHPFLTPDENDMFRAVHDVFGHLASGRGFDRHGEDAAWFAHGRVYSALARLAMTTETRGQTSTFIWRHQGRRFPDQKLLLLPARFCDPAQVSVRASGGRKLAGCGRWR